MPLLPFAPIKLASHAGTNGDNSDAVYAMSSTTALAAASPRAAAMAAAEDYEKNRYHAPGDEFDEKWDWSGVMSDLKLYYRIGRMLAMTDAWPNWNDGDEFRAVRDKSRNGK